MRTPIVLYPPAPERRPVSFSLPAVSFLAPLGECLAALAPRLGRFLIALAIAVAPFLFVIEYDEQNEPTPKLTPEMLENGLVWLGLALLLAKFAGMLGPFCREWRVAHLLSHRDRAGAAKGYLVESAHSVAPRPEAWLRAWIRVSSAVTER